MLQINTVQKDRDRDIFSYVQTYRRYGKELTFLINKEHLQINKKKANQIVQIKYIRIYHFSSATFRNLTYWYSLCKDKYIKKTIALLFKKKNTINNPNIHQNLTTQYVVIYHKI